ncbi:Choline dehydrogenase [Microbacterium esteraromaticum]|uniref:Choline dehydrogenase n=1 Tax=Microbacterium esteraromaticum TaxID=57043 RepID=A0A1R4KBV3_9MICO|nr:GMC family oxidoreductase N-terminal domain-containing protein [Microbacterium esteraromaticum]SJN41634.1 Choline dehydrogenase [Microbacterium esteraromaticum]
MSNSDYIVVGAGSAGSAVTRRLIDAGFSVHVIEAGPVDTDPNIHSPQGWPALLMSASDWAVMTTPQVHAGNRPVYWPRGKVLGGSSSLNGMIYMRGDKRDYDSWADAGATGWGWNDVLPLFKRSEDHADGESDYHGVGGPLHVERIDPGTRHPAAAAFVEAAVQAGIDPTDDFNEGSLDGAGFNHTTTKDGKRASAWQSYVTPISDSPLLTVTTGALVHRVIIESGRAVGVEYSSDGTVTEARANVEVIISAGAIGSPKILLLSGIGPAADLEALGIDVVKDLPGVGENLHDHLLVSVLYESNEPIAAGQNNLLEAQFYSRSTDWDGPAPDLQPLFIHLPYPTDGVSAPEQGYTIAAGIVRPQSRGTLKLASADPADAPLVDPNIFGDERDLEAMVDAVIISRKVGDQDALAPFRKSEFAPGADVTSREELREFCRRTVGTYHHQVGTCRIGTDELSVVDPELRVHGIAGLRVADASVMPSVPSANTNAPSIMIGEKASDLLLASATSNSADRLVGTGI